MDIKDVLSKHLRINRLTEASLKEAITRRYEQLPDNEKRRINREIAHTVIYPSEVSVTRKKYDHTINTGSLSSVNVLAINHIGPLDITINWKTGPDGLIEPTGCCIDAGGDQINVSKAFSHFGENIALIALAGKKGAEITGIWERIFLDNSIIPVLIRALEDDQQVAVYNMVDCTPLPGMFGWGDELSTETVEHINREAMNTLEKLFKGRPGDIWMVLSAGGPLRYNSALAYYASLVKQVKNKYRNRVRFLIDFKFMSGPEEAMSILEIHRNTPQDIIKPNLEEFIQILVSSGLAAKGSLDRDTIPEKTVKEYAIALRNKYNLMGVLISMDRSGLMLVMRDRVIREKGIDIAQVCHPASCHTAAGDSLKAGLLYALSRGSSFEEAVHTGNLFGASTASMEGSQTVTPETLARIEALACSQNVAPEVEYL